MFRKFANIRITITFILIILFSWHSFAQTWDIPADKKAKNSYLKFDINTAKEGEAIFTKNCQTCHGNPGKGNSLKKLNPIPPDLAGAQTQNRTDGELFYIIATGRLIMPSFKNIFSENERWKLISFIRSFNNKYVQTLSTFDPEKSKLVKVNFVFDKPGSKIRVDVKANEKTGIIPLKDAEISLFAKRYFGKLQIDKTLRTNSEGIAIFNFPKDLPGDKIGNVDLIANLNDEIYGEVESQSKLKIGIPIDKPGLTEKIANWNVLKKAPVWIIITYTSMVLAVGLVLLFIVKSLMKLNKLGNN